MSQTPTTNQKPSNDTSAEVRATLQRFLRLRENDTLPTSERLLDEMLQIELERERHLVEEKHRLNFQLSMQYLQMAIQAQIPPHLIPLLFASGAENASRYVQPISNRSGRINSQQYSQPPLMNYAKFQEENAKAALTRPITPSKPNETSHPIAAVSGAVNAAAPVTDSSETGIEFQHYNGPLRGQSLSPSSQMQAQNSLKRKRGGGRKTSNASTSSNSTRAHKRSQSEMVMSASQLDSPYLPPPKLNGTQLVTHLYPISLQPPPMSQQQQLQQHVSGLVPPHQYMHDPRLFQTPQFRGTMSPQLYSELGSFQPRGQTMTYSGPPPSTLPLAPVGRSPPPPR